MDKNITIVLKLAGSDYRMRCSSEDEPLYREAADLIRKEYQRMLDAYQANVGEKDLLVYTLLQVAMRLKILESKYSGENDRLQSLERDLSDYLKTL
jgi:cell division protein ZapA (FtsZ GTPase activity inhibitor)